MNGCWMYRTGSWKETTLYQTPILTCIGGGGGFEYTLNVHMHINKDVWHQNSTNAL